MTKHANKLKALTVCLLSVVLMLALAACSDEQNKITKQAPLMVLVTVNGTMGDNSINDAAWSGFEKASEKKDIDIRCLESEGEDSFEENLKSAVNDEASLICLTGNEDEETVEKYAADNPGIGFIVVGGQSNGENISAIDIKVQEMGFLAGVAAAKASETKKVGFLYNGETPNAESYEAGFKAGIKYAGNDVKAMVEKTGASNEAAQKKALKMNEKGADVIYQAEGAYVQGAIDAADDKDFYVIGNITDQSVLSSEHVLCSVTCDLDSIVVKAIKKAGDSSPQSEDLEVSAEEKSIDISDHAGNMPDELKEELKDIKKQIKSGNIKVPATKAELKDFDTAEDEK